MISERVSEKFMSAIRSKTIRTGIVLNGRPLSEQYSGLKADLVYLGSEFCQNLLPGPAEFGRALKLFRRPVVLATPLLTDELFRNIEAVIRARGGSGGPLEIVATCSP